MKRAGAFVALAVVVSFRAAANPPDPCDKYKGDQARQLGCYQARVTQDAKDVDARIAVGAIFLAQSKNAAALEQFDKVLTLTGGNVRAMNGKALVLIAMGKTKDGVRLLEEAMAVDPTNVQTLTNYGRVALEAGDVPAAADAFNYALSLAPNDTEANLGIAELHLGKGDRDEAIKYFYKAVQADEGNERANYLLGVTLMDGSPELAIPFLEHASYIAAGDVNTWLALGRARFRAGQYRLAGQAFVEAGHLSPDEPVVYLEIGKTYVELGELADAEEAYLAGFDLAKNAPPEVRAQLHTHMGILQQQKKQYGTAAGQYRKALALVPDDTLAKLNLGVVQNLGGNLEAAAETFRDLVDEHPDMDTARYNLAITLLDLGRREEALPEIEALPDGSLKTDAKRHKAAPDRLTPGSIPPPSATKTPQLPAPKTHK